MVNINQPSFEFKPLVSVLMTAYNREKYIAEAIESVLASDYINFELIIVDDASSDSTLQIAQQYAQKDDRIKLHINENNLTQWPTRNKAASLAIGKYIKYLDSDDTIYDWGLGYCVEMMEKYPEAAMGLLSKSNLIKKEFLLPNEAIRINLFEELFLNVGPSGTILRKDAFEKVGFYNPNYGVPSDMYFNLQMAGFFPIVLLKKEFFYYRIHEGQEYNNKYSYLYNNYRYINDVINLEGFPLDQVQKRLIRNRAKKSFVMEFLMYLKNERNIQKALKAFNHSGIGIIGFMKGILENIKS